MPAIGQFNCMILGSGRSPFMCAGNRPKAEVDGSELEAAKPTLRLLPMGGRPLSRLCGRNPSFTQVSLLVDEYSPACRPHKVDGSMLRRLLAQYPLTGLQGMLFVGSPTCLASSGTR
jgi:hypothetical protein